MSPLEAEFMSRCTMLADNRRMLRVTPDEAAFLKLVCRIEEDPPWAWPQSQVREVVDRIVFFVDRKTNEQLERFLRHYSLDSLISPRSSQLLPESEPIHRLRVALGLFPEEFQEVDTLVVFK